MWRSRAQSLSFSLEIPLYCPLSAGAEHEVEVAQFHAKLNFLAVVATTYFNTVGDADADIAVHVAREARRREKVTRRVNVSVL